MLNLSVHHVTSRLKRVNANVLSIYGADNIRKILSFLKLINCLQKPVMVWN